MKQLKRLATIFLAFTLVVSIFSGVSAMAAGEHASPSGVAELKNSGRPAVSMANTLMLSEGWKIQSSELVTQPDNVVGTGGANVNGWYPAVVPSTVLGALIDAGDPTYPDEVLNHLYEDANFALPYRSRFEVPWWYRNEFTLPASENGKKVILNLEKINYQAEIYVNGTKLENKYVSVPESMLLNRYPEVTDPADPSNTSYAADPINPTEAGTAKIADQYADFTKKFIGAFRNYELDITDLVTCDGTTKNTIAIKVTRPIYGSDLTVYWVD